MKLRYTLLAASSVVIWLGVTGCEKKTEAPTPAGSAAATATAGAGATGGAGGAGTAATTGAAAAGAVAAAPGGTVVAANNHGIVTVNDAGVVTARRENGDKVVTNPNGVTTANGVVVDSKKGTVVVPGVGTFAAPPH